MSRETYTHGHHDSVLRSHRWRTAENSAGYLLAHLNEDASILDVGCGPGTITADLAQRVPTGSVVGIDTSQAVLDEASAVASGLSNCTFETGDVYHLRFENARFDIVHAHQVLQHLADPVAALSEMRRVLRPNGILAVRDADYGAMFWSPSDLALERWRSLYIEVATRNGGNAQAGRALPSWVRSAGFHKTSVSGSLWTFADHDTRTWWASSWAERVEHSALGTKAVDYALADAEDLAALAAAWRAWSAHEDGFFAVPHVEVLARP